MKSKIAFLGSLFLLAVISIGVCGNLPLMDVSVSDAGGKVVYRGKTSAKGSFSTGVLPKGNYVILFNSKAPLKSNLFALAARAGQQKVTAYSVPSKQFVGGGVAMKLGIGGGMSITGEIAEAGATSGQGSATVKYINGKKFIWLARGSIGSNLGGRWVEEGSLDALNANTLSPDAVRRIQDQADTHQEGFPTRGFDGSPSTSGR